MVVPLFDADARKLREFGNVFFCRGFRTGCQFAQKIYDLGCRSCHLRGQRVLGKIVETNQFCGFMAQRQNRLDVVAVVPLGVAALLGRARDPGTIEALAQTAIVGVPHHSVIRRIVQRQ